MLKSKQFSKIKLEKKQQKNTEVLLFTNDLNKIKGKHHLESYVLLFKMKSFLTLLTLSRWSDLASQTCAFTMNSDNIDLLQKGYTLLNQLNQHSSFYVEAMCFEIRNLFL